MRKHIWKITLFVIVGYTTFVGINKKGFKSNDPKNINDFNQLLIEELRSGNGLAATPSSRVRIHYVEWLMRFFYPLF